ncbi:MAG: hypothetical protein GY762_02415 [Proteobacteria bacterium]|nr:hypothetical protein [Pseudomonadota bacterium]
MKQFKTIDEVDDWLEPMNYREFWCAIKPYCLVLPPADGCDDQITSGEVELVTILDGLKYLARIELTKRHGLHTKLATPWLKLVESH